MQNVTKRIVSFALALVLVLSLIPTQPVFAESEEITASIATTESTESAVETAPIECSQTSTAQSGYYTYTVTNGEAVITDCYEWISGDIIIPAVLDGYPVLAIGERAFSGCRMTSVRIPDGVNAIGEYAFYSCQQLTSVSISNSVTAIGEGAFLFCYGMSNITIPDSVTTIEEGAFYDCNSLTDVYYTGTTEQWNAITIAGSNELLTNATIHTIEVVASGTCGANLTWALDDAGTLAVSGTGAMEDYYGPSSVPWNDYKSQIKLVNFDSGVTTIGCFAFYDCNSLTSVTIPDGVTTIGKYAFYNCDSLTSVSIGNGVTTIGDYAFESCDSLTSLLIGSNVTTIGRFAFYWCVGLTTVTIPDSVTTIDEYAFDYCKNVSSLHLGNSLTTIGEYAFCQCEVLTELTIPDSVVTIGKSAFSNCYDLIRLDIPDGVTTIGDYAFGNCADLKEVTIPKSVTYIAPNAFTCCYTLKGIWVAEDNSVYSSDANGALFDKEKTNLIRVPGGFTGTYSVPNTVETIGDSAFFCCISLTAVAIPDSVTTIGEDAFYNCDSLTDVYYHGTAEQWAAITVGSYNEPLLNATLHTDETKQTPDGFVYESAEDGTVSIIGYAGTAAELEIPAVIDGKSVTDIVYAAFARYTGLTDVTIPDSVITIGNSAFYGCSNLSSVHIGSGVTTIADDAFTQCTGLTSVAIPDNVITIGVDAFYDCSNLTSVTIGKGVTAIDGGAFYHCDSLKGIWIHEDNPVYSSDRNGMLYNKDKTQLIQTPGGVVFGEIPEGVTTILDSAFRARINLSGVVIPSSVTAIDSGAFFFCLNLTDVYYSGTAEQWAAIALDADGNDPLLNATMHYRSGACGENLLWTLDDTGTLTISGTGEMYDYGDDNIPADLAPWFEYRGDIIALVIENGLTNIGQSAFYDCDSVTEVTIPDSVTSLGWHAFRDCDRLSDISLGTGVVEIRAGAFSGDSLIEVTIPDNVVKLGSSAFFGPNLNTIRIGAGVSYIGSLEIGGWESPNLQGFWVSEDNPNYSSDACGVLYNKDMTRLIRYPAGREGIYEIPYGVTNIQQMSFSECAKLTGLTVPETVVGMESGAFNCCASMSTIALPASLKTTLAETFFGCTNLTHVFYAGTQEQWQTLSISEAGEIGNATLHFSVDSGFCGDNLVWSLDDAGTLTISGTGAMPSFAESDIPWADYRSQIRYVVIADGVTSICAYAFYDCDELLSVRIPVSVTEIGDGAFFACSSLKEIAIPEGVTAIGEETFCYCTGLVNVTLPRSVTVIEDYAFSTCVRLTDVYYSGKASRWETISIGTDNDALIGATLHAAAYEPCQITEHPADQLTGYMETAQFTVVASDAATYRWQFRRNAEDSWKSTTLSGYKTATLSVTMTTGRNGYQYRCVVTGMDGTVHYTDAATLTMDAELEIIRNPADSTALEGSIAPFTVEATDVRSYRWYYRRNAEDDWHPTAMNGYVTPTLQVLAALNREGYQYMSKLTGVDGSVTYTEPATLHVTPVILTQPDDGAGAIGETVSFHVEAQNVARIQWLYRRSAEDAWSPTKMEGNQTATLKVGVTAGREGYQYMAKITNTDGNLVYSDVVTLYLAPSVTQQPESVAAEIGSVAQFCVAADNVVAYQWQYSRDGAAWSNTKAEGNKTSAITVTATAGNHGYQYRCKLTGLGGSVVYTDAATLTTYRPLLIEIIAHPSNRSAEEGKTVKFATVVDGDVQSYCWQYYDTASEEWVDASYTGFDANIMSAVMTKELHGCRFRCVVTDTNGNQLVTDEATLTLKTS